MAQAVRCRNVLLLHELHASVLLEELEVADEVERLRAHLELGEPDHFGERARAVAPHSAETGTPQNDAAGNPWR